MPRWWAKRVGVALSVTFFPAVGRGGGHGCRLGRSIVLLVLFVTFIAPNHLASHEVSVIREKSALKMDKIG